MKNTKRIGNLLPLIAAFTVFASVLVGLNLTTSALATSPLVTIPPPAPVPDAIPAAESSPATDQAEAFMGASLNAADNVSDNSPVASAALTKNCHYQGSTLICHTVHHHESKRHAIVRLAKRELRANRNQAGELAWLQSHGIGDARDPWCAYFVSYIYNAADVSGAPHTGCSGAIGLWARDRGQWHPIRGPGAQNYRPKPGDAVIFSTGSGTSGLICPTSTHVGIVVRARSHGRFDSINGNWGDKVTLITNQTNSFTANGGSVLGFASPVKD